MTSVRVTLLYSLQEERKIEKKREAGKITEDDARPSPISSHLCLLLPQLCYLKRERKEGREDRRMLTIRSIPALSASILLYIPRVTGTTVAAIR